MEAGDPTVEAADLGVPGAVEASPGDFADFFGEAFTPFLPRGDVPTARPLPLAFTIFCLGDGDLALGEPPRAAGCMPLTPSPLSAIAPMIAALRIIFLVLLHKCF